ncbi:recombinase [Longispora urticae]
MLSRLAELEDDLQRRRAQALAEGWIGEIEGIDLTMRFLAEKRHQAQRVQRLTVELGLPSIRTISAQA